MYIDKHATLDALHFQPDAKILKNSVIIKCTRIGRCNDVRLWVVSSTHEQYFGWSGYKVGKYVSILDLWPLGYVRAKFLGVAGQIGFVAD